jgi:hypothetical protein
MTLRIEVLSSNDIDKLVVLSLFFHAFDPSGRLVGCYLEGTFQPLQLGLLDADEL